MDDDEDEVVEDMITIKNLTEEALLINLQKRFENNLIYTYTGKILISVNPYKLLPIYTGKIINQYAGAPLGHLPPHVFAVADEAYRNMLASGNQSILISGESGSGKTEATKLIMQYLAAITSKHSRVEQQILDTNAILESFGNAKTVRNNNSSRFGKYMKIHFDSSGHISGANIKQYLLEKSRLVFQSDDERNYHSFYQLCVGASEEDKKAWHLSSPENFHYTNQSSCISIDGVDDAAEYAAARKALDVLGVSTDEQQAIFRILAGILHLGNITFKFGVDSHGQEDEESSMICDDQPLEYAAELFMVEKDRLKKDLLTRQIKSGLEMVTANLKVSQAQDSRDALAKAIYSKLFEWLVEKINVCIGADDSLPFIGVLDIFGFENFSNNLFEQFCINYANEKLHQHFNQYIFKLEQEVYDQEGINWSKIDFTDNEECVLLIERKGDGMLAMLDEECRVPNGSDEAYVEKMHQKLGSHKHYSKPKITLPGIYGVHHYAGEVEYDAVNSLEKNRDTLHQGLTEMMRPSKCPLLASLFMEKKDPGKSKHTQGGGRGKRGGAMRQLTVGSKFKDQLGNLMSTMAATQPHYVRCIKPNTKKSADMFENELVTLQLRYSGMLETIRVRRSGYPIRNDFAWFWKRYRLISPSVDKSKDKKKDCTEVLQKAAERLVELGISEDDYKVGKTKVFFRDKVHGALEKLREKVVGKSALKIQRIFRGYREKKRYGQMKASSVVMQARIRGFLARQKYIEMRNSAVTAQRVWRGFGCARHYRKLRHAAVVAAKNCRCVVARKRYLRLRNAAIRVQTTVRAFFPRRRFRMMRKAVVPLQASLRMHQPRNEFRQKRRAAKKIQRLIHRWLWAKHYAERCEGAALKLQKIIRRFVAVSKYKRLRKGALTAQTCWRGVKARRDYTEFVKKHKASIIIQASVRCFVMSSRYWRKRTSACVIQAWFRMIHTGLSYPSLALQAGLRRKMADVKFSELLKSTTRIQASFRGYKARKEVRALRVAASVIRRAWKAYRWRQILRRRAMMKLAVSRIQASFRMRVVRDRYLSIKHGIITVQAHFKGRAARRAYKRMVRMRPATDMTESVKEDFTSTTMKDYALAQYKTQFVGVRSQRQQLKPDELSEFTSNPMNDSLLTLPKDIVNGVDRALEMFKLVQKYMGEAFAKKVGEIEVAHSLIKEAASCRSLGDELYCQLCRQVSNNPSPASVRHGWEIMAMCAGCFAPQSKDLFHPVRGFCQIHESPLSEVEDQVRELARLTHRRMVRTFEKGPRKTIPCSEELQAVVSRELLVVSVRSEISGDGELHEAFADPTTTAAEVLVRITRDMGMRGGRWGTALFARCGKEERILQDEEYIIDAVRRGMKEEPIKTTQPRNPDADFVLKGNCQIILRKHIYLRTEANALDESVSGTIDVLFEDAVKKVAHAGDHMFGASIDDLTLLLAYQLQATEGLASKSHNIDVPSLITHEGMLECMEENEWSKKIMDVWTSDKVSKLSECTTKLNFLKLFSQLPLYGTYMSQAIVAISELRDTMLMPQCYLGISEAGLSFYSRGQDDQSDEGYESRRFVKESKNASFGFAQLDKWKVEGDEDATPSKDAANLQKGDEEEETPVGAEDVNETAEEDPKASMGTIASFWIKEDPMDERAPSRRIEVCMQSEDGVNINTALDLLESYRVALSKQATQAVARFDHIVTDPALLSFVKGDVIEVTSKDDATGWYQGVLKDRSGFFPRAVVELVIAPIQIVAANKAKKAPVETPQDNVVVSRGRGATVVQYKREQDVVDDDDRSLKTMAEKYFVSPEEDEKEKETGGWGGFFKSAVELFTGLDWESLTKHTSESIKHPMLKSLMDDPKLYEIAVSNFEDVMRYIGGWYFANDSPSQGMVLQERLAQQICARGIENPELRSEIIFQICRQCIGNPVGDKDVTRGWELLAICLGCFLPADELIVYFRAGFIHSADREARINHFDPSITDCEAWADFCTLRMRRTARNGARMKIPDSAELSATRERRPVVARIWLPTGKSHVLLIDPATTTREAMQSLAKSLGLRSIAGYSLFLSYEGDTSHGRSLRDNDHLLDFLSMAREDGDENAESSKGKHYGFIFKRKLHYPQQEDLSNPKSVNLLYSQLLSDVVGGRFCCTEENACIHAACQLAVEILDEQRPRDSRQMEQFMTKRMKDHLDRYIPAPMLDLHSLSEWQTLVCEASRNKNIQLTSSYMAQLSYIRHGKEWTHYGAGLFQAEIEECPRSLRQALGIKLKKDAKKSKPRVVIVVHKTGVSVFKSPSVDGKCVAEYGYDAILQWVHFGSNWILITGGLMDQTQITFVTQDACEMSELVECYSHLHVEEKRATEESDQGRASDGISKGSVHLRSQ